MIFSSLSQQIMARYTQRLAADRNNGMMAMLKQSIRLSLKVVPVHSVLHTYIIYYTYIAMDIDLDRCIKFYAIKF